MGMGSDEDSFVAALRAIDGKKDAPMHCKGHMYRMRIHAYVGRDLDGCWRLTAEGKLRAFPERGRLRVTRARVNDAIHNEGLGLVRSSTVLYKTRTARDHLRSSWYTPDYAKDLAAS